MTEGFNGDSSFARREQECRPDKENAKAPRNAKVRIC